MSALNVYVTDGVIVEEHVVFSLADLCRACDAAPEQLLELVSEGLLEPQGSSPDEWRFSGSALLRTRTAMRLAGDLALSPAGVALVMDLLDEIASLRARLRS